MANTSKTLSIPSLLLRGSKTTGTLLLSFILFCSNVYALNCSHGGKAIPFIFRAGSHPVKSEIIIYKQDGTIRAGNVINEDKSWSTTICPDDQIAAGTFYLAVFVCGLRCWNYHINKNASSISMNVNGSEGTSSFYADGATQFKGEYNHAFNCFKKKKGNYCPFQS